MLRLLLVAVVVAAGSSAGCGDGSAPRAQPCPTPSAAGDTTVLPSDLGFERWGTLTRAEERPAGVVAEVVTETSIIELYPPVARSVLDAGYDIISAENEGFEAEIFFARGRAVTGAFRFREGPCEDQVTLKLFYATDDRRDG